jgi:PAS domain S-box-containing protein
MDNLDETKLNETILRLFFELPFIGMAITSPATKRWVKFNDHLCEILGYSREELPQITWTEITHPDDLELDVTEFERVMQGETEGYVMDKRFIRKDGRVIDAAIDVKCVRKEDHTIDFFIATVQDISDRKRAEAKQKQVEQALAESEERYRQVVQTQIDFVLRSQPDTTITFANESFCRALGMKLDQVIGLKWSDLVSPDEIQNILQKISKLSLVNPKFFGENHNQWAYGQIVFTQWINQGIFDDRGQLTGIQSAGRDVTALKNAEIALQKLNDELETRIEQRTSDLQLSEARNLAIVNALPDLLLLLKPDGTCIQCIMPSNDDKSKYIPIQHHISEILPPENLTAQLQLYKKAITTGEVQIYEHQLSKFGKTVYEEVRITPYGKDELLVIVRDISDRKLAEKLLLKSDTHLKTAQRIGKLGSWEYEVNTGKLTWSDEVFRIYGLEPSLYPPSYEELQLYIHPDDWPHFNQTVQTAISIEQSYDLEHRLIQPSGKLIYVIARGEMIYNASGQLTHIIGTAMDITDRKLAEAKILHTANQLANTNRELESFSYSVSHDLRAPLRHMNGFVNALQQRLKSHEALQDPKVNHYLQVIEKSSQKMGHLIDGLLMLSRFGRRPLESKQISIRDLVDEAIEIIRTDPSHNPLVKFAIGDLPNTFGDPTLLQQVFRNLIGNAVKFSRNHPQPYIEIDSLLDQTIRIRDNGVGFQMEYADKLFGAFQRLHNDSEFEGTGIGLAIVQRIIQRHGGSIWAEGYPDQGATFFVKL